MGFWGAVPGGSQALLFGRFLGARGGTITIHRSDFKRLGNHRTCDAIAGQLPLRQLPFAKYQPTNQPFKSLQPTNQLNNPFRPWAETWSSWEIIVFRSRALATYYELLGSGAPTIAQKHPLDPPENSTPKAHLPAQSI